MEKLANPLQRLSTFGQSVWLDFLSRKLIQSGELARLIEEDGLRGITTNPSIFEKAIRGGHEYDDQIDRLARQGKPPEEIFESLAVDDVQHAADRLRPLYDRLKGEDGFVSIEVSPHHARDDDATLAEARHLWHLVDRPNVMIKVPATQEGLAVIEQLTSEGINVNITLLFSLPRYRKVADAYLTGLEKRAAHRESLDPIASVASFFLSRIDSAVDPMLDEIVRERRPKAQTAAALRGKTAINCAKVAYEMYGGLFGSSRFAVLADRSARRQRLLWASTGTKDPAYSDVMYVEALIGPQTIATIPVETLKDYREHGNPAPRLQENVAASYNELEALAELGIDVEEVAGRLEEEGIRKFIEAWDRLMQAIEEKVAAAAPGPGRSP